MRHIQDQPPRQQWSDEGPVSLVLLPTRELALQVHREANAFGSALGLVSICAYGGGLLGDQLKSLKMGCDILSGTPGRLIDVLTTSGGKITNLRKITYMVIDEADRMFDMGFE